MAGEPSGQELSIAPPRDWTPLGADCGGFDAQRGERAFGASRRL